MSQERKDCIFERAVATLIHSHPCKATGKTQERICAMKKKTRINFGGLLLAGALFLSPFPALSTEEESGKDIPETPEISQEEASSQTSKESLPAPEPSKTSQQVTIDGKVISYDATAELMPLFDNPQEEIARIFYVDYRRTDLTSEDEALRPVSFAFNGGPGSSALMLHLGLLGPRTVKTTPEGLKMPSPPYLVEENPDSLLDVTDLVFVDPVGTGYSRANNEEDLEKFWGVKEDARAVAEFIRMYLTRNNRWGAPIYLIGESYGGIRATTMAKELAETGIVPSGIVLISPAVSYGEMQNDSGNHRPFIHNLTTMALAARYHKKLSPELAHLESEEFTRKVRAWAQNDYARALWKGNALSSRDFEETARRGGRGKWRYKSARQKGQ